MPWRRPPLLGGPLGGSAGHFHTRLPQTLSLAPTPLRKVGAVVGITLALLLPVVAPGTVVRQCVAVTVMVLAALALNLLTGVAGQLSLGAAGFMALGAFSMVIVQQWQDVPFLAVALAVVGSGAICGVILGLPSLRLRGLYLILATLGFHYVVWFLTHQYEASRGSLALTGLVPETPQIGSFQWAQPTHWYYTVLVINICVSLFVLNLQRSRFGRAWTAVRERDIVATAMGVHVAMYKVLVFAVSGALLSLAGMLYAMTLGVVSAQAFNLTLAIEVIAMIVIGGLGSVAGAWLGATFVVLVPFGIQWLATQLGASPGVQLNYLAPAQLIIFGLVMIGFLVFEPTGINGIWLRIRKYFQLWPLRHAHGN